MEFLSHRDLPGLGIPEPFDGWRRRRTVVSVLVRQSRGYRAADRCYNSIEALVKALRLGRGLSARRQRELGVSSPAEFVAILRPHFRRLMRLYRVTRFRDLLPHYGKCRGCWQFHHRETPYRIDPADETQLLERCHVSNVEPVTWEENMRLRYATPQPDTADELPLQWT